MGVGVERGMRTWRLMGWDEFNTSNNKGIMLKSSSWKINL